ncbi:hypothetical protein MMC07_009218 [Pseudocyphellaria aurata]|nr:hypothetical protein [Pseudocyphellaria aurata]
MSKAANEPKEPYMALAIYAPPTNTIDNPFLSIDQSSFFKDEKNDKMTSQPQQSGGIFGQSQQSQLSNPFGTLGQQQQKPLSIFATSNQQQQTSQQSNPFGTLGQPQQQTQQSNPFLLGSQQQQPQQQQPQQSNPFLLGSQQQQPQQQQPQQSNPFLLGSQQQQPQQQQPQQQPEQNPFLAAMQRLQPQQSNVSGGLGQQSSIFGSTTQQQQQPQQNLLFGDPNQPQQQPQQSSVFGFPSQQQQSQPTNNIFASLTGSTSQPEQSTQQTSSNGLIPAYPNGQQQAQQQGSGIRQPRLWQIPDPQIRPKSVTVQMDAAFSKWNPESPDTLFQTYLYNFVPPDQAPFYSPGSQDDETKWEEALSKKPSPGAIPVLVKGFEQLGRRMIVQRNHLEILQGRLHEIDGGLRDLLRKHDLQISIRAAECKRKHLRLNHQCLLLAAKVQVLRNRGYSMDSAEEKLREKMLKLERGVLDPTLTARGEEIWARMVSLRERSRQLHRELEKAGKSVGPGQVEEMDEEVMKRARKILEDYGSQLSHLTKEVSQIQKDFAEWNQSPTGGIGIGK